MGDGAEIAARLRDVAAELGLDELRVLVTVAERLALGRAVYGRLDLNADGRDFHRETLEEAADGLVYAACGLLRGRRRGLA